ncbi:GGDEF domain-containing protein [Adhaeretor mobilis]|uniref:Putative diguanylate cyclase YdaM n=1 Tax=Adhaeretor mobilis TaxID=1930276 RepID=A0A517MVT6_9BACT|nr:GGDEF domain-containing protein [Adhaeretor mobilis]QDS98991.1 putative diguanylate cyclase YdaM [Adhaeretor mobilis]
MTPSKSDQVMEATPPAATSASEAHCLFDAKNGQLVAIDELAAAWLGTPDYNLAGATLDGLLPAEEVQNAYANALLSPGTRSNPCPLELSTHLNMGDLVPILQIDFVQLRGLPAVGAPLGQGLSQGHLQIEPDRKFVLATIKIKGPVEKSTHRDALTGLLDRTALDSAQVLKEAQPYAVLFADLNDFKLVNDQHGHAAGDVVLQEIARRWQEAIRDDDLLVRYGGDEFVFVLPRLESLTATLPIVERLQRALNEPIRVGDLKLSVGVAIGVAIGNGESSSMAELVHKADRAMYANKPGTLNASSR